jgi:ABC-type branched-subunit amino acid transport system ATPase component
MTGAEDLAALQPAEARRALRALGVSVKFEGLRALSNVDLDVSEGEILGLIGPNGAGKTTLVNVLSGFQKPSSGRVELAGCDIAGLQQHEVARLGLGRTFQAARLFPQITVLENVEVAATHHGIPRARATAKAEELLGYLGLHARRDYLAKAVTYGEARLVGIARALALNPKFLLLDEPAAGMSPQEAMQLMRQISAIRDDFKCGVIVIEHNMQMVMNLCDRVHVLARGATIADGKPDEVQASNDVKEAYLGQSLSTGVVVKSRPAEPSQAPELLSVDGLVVDYGPVRALASVSLSVRQGEFVAVIGPNGAGKSTLLSCISGQVKPKAGNIVFKGTSLAKVSAVQRVRSGIALVPEGRRVLSSLTVEENLLVGMTTVRDKHEGARRLDYVLDIFPILKSRLSGYAGRLSGGEQQQLVIARALLSNPDILLLDEPSLGLAPLMIETVYETLVALNKQGMTILLMEQNANRALGAGDRAYVMRHGAMELQGMASELLNDPALERAYFGFDTHAMEAAQ